MIHTIHRVESDERGATLVIIALSLVALIAVTALVIDGGANYSDRRQVQNAVDAGALTGANALQDWKSSALSGGAVDASTIWADVQAKVSADGAGNNGNLLNCEFIDFNGNPLMSGGSPVICSSQSGTTNATVMSADGVLVAAQDTKKTAFAQISNQSTFTAGAHAAATIQPVVGANTPFIICGNPALGGYDLLTNGQPDLAKLEQYSVGGAKAPLVLQGTTVQKSCNGSANCKGKDDPSVPIVVPGDALCANGNGNSHTVLASVEGQVPCPPGGPFTGCDLLVPLADSAAPAGSDTLHVVAWTVWQAFGNGTGDPKYFGFFVAIGSPVTGAGGERLSCQVNGAVPCVVHLIQ